MDGMCYDPRLITFEFLSRLVLRKKQVPCDAGVEGEGEKSYQKSEGCEYFHPKHMSK